MANDAWPSPSAAALARVVDRAAIADLVYEYARTMDLNLPSELAALFTEDCVVDYGEGLGGRIDGRAALERFVADSLPNVEATSHHVSNVQVRFEGPAAATGVAYLYAWHRFADERQDATLWGQYHDRFVRTSSGWRIAQRTLRVAGEEAMGFGAWHPIGRRTASRGARSRDE